MKPGFISLSTYLYTQGRPFYSQILGWPQKQTMMDDSYGQNKVNVVWIQLDATEFLSYEQYSLLWYN